MRRLLLALLGLVGVGVSLAQRPGGYPETYSIAGDAVVEALWTLSDAGVDTAMTGLRYSQAPGGTTYEIPVQWDYDTEQGPATYTGTLEVQPRGMWPLIGTFYSAVCQTPDTEDCGQWGTGETLTAMDIWRRKEWGVLLPWTFPEGSYSQDNECTRASNGEKYLFRTMYDPGDPGGGIPAKYRIQVESPLGQVTSNNYSSRGAAESAITGSVETYCQGLAWSSTRLDLFRDGGAYFLNASPPSVSTVRDGVRVVFIEAFGEAARLGMLDSGELVLLDGMALNPPPAPEAVGGEPPETDPGGGEGGGEVDPGDCDEGWFLTRVVCEIRTQGERLWTFISHDAWVPEVPVAQRVEWLQDGAADKIPFAFIGSGDGLYLSIIGNVGSMVEESDDTVIRRWLREDWTPAECPTWSIHPRTFAPWLQPGTVEAVEMNICTTSYGEWMHETGRGWLNMAMIFGLSLWFVTSLLGLGNGR